MHFGQSQTTMDDSVTKRFHISGLTPALIQKDLSTRLSTFATVKSFDGFGLFNALNEPRNFAYVTLEGTASNLSRCQNFLNGATWKGAKLRISDAKPDFRARILQERETDIMPPPKKRRKTCGVEAADMSLVTPQNVGSRSGWKVTPLGRMIRLVRMRPLRPLPDPVTGVTTILKDVGKRTKWRRAKILTRMRRRTIDPLKWNSTYLKGVFLEAEEVPTAKIPENNDISQDHRNGDSDEDTPGANKTRTCDVPSTSPEFFRPGSPTPIDHADVIREKDKSMDILRSLFEDVETEAHEKSSPLVAKQSNREFPGSEADENEGRDVPKNKPINGNPTFDVPDQKTGQKTTQLKDLFAPTEDAGDFSIIGHLGLDLEFDDDIQIPNITSPPSAFRAEADTYVQPSRAARVDTKTSRLPLFFPARSGDKAKKRLKDVFDSARERGWNWRDPAVGFWRSESEAEIRGKWESEKVELTRSWKKRWREASKTRRRVGGEGAVRW